MAHVFGGRHWVRTENTIFRVMRSGYNIWSVTSITHDKLGIYLVQCLQCTKKKEAQGHAEKAEVRLELFCTLHAHTSLFQEQIFFPI